MYILFCAAYLLSHMQFKTVPKKKKIIPINFQWCYVAYFLVSTFFPIFRIRLQNYLKKMHLFRFVQYNDTQCHEKLVYFNNCNIK